ncbi:MAG: ribonuclease Z [Nitrospinales bacterium]
MKQTLQPSLVNDPFGDPGLLVEFTLEKRAILFDLGDISALSVATLLKVSHVFVSHTHIDHFIGFDRMLRVQFGRAKTLYLYGPKNFIENVEGKLAGFSWNLVDRYEDSLTIEAVEVREDHVLRARFSAIEKFKKPEVIRETLVDGLLLDEESFTVRTAILEHRIPCLGFALEEKERININKDRLAEMNLTPDRWLAELKKNIKNEKSDDLKMSVSISGEIEVKSKDYTLGELKKELVDITQGQKIAYIVDTVYSEKNKPKITNLVREADCFFCESPFLADEEERGRERCHLTTRQAGLLAREAEVKELKIFHFSSKHSHCRDQFYLEADDAFQHG